ncbi:hypothetical protein E2986_04703 [Frieseomelitta varia]|uniref:Mitochondrial genome maintenance exonuclease 1 n=1 Tax=Frieseomelitta varia TaxID=561572 RepID=A0A833VWN3_9HYME|nr:hypothetical protein E2986_04703 [Frieseomelitta varia]
MFSSNIAESAGRALLKLNIKENKVLKEYTNNSKVNNGTVETQEISKLQNATNFETELNQASVSNNSIDNVYKQTQNNEAVNKLEVVNKIKVMRNIKSFSIFGDGITENYEMQCLESSENSKIPDVTYILNETMPPKVKAALDTWKKNMIDTYGEEYFKTYCKGILNDNKLFHSCMQNVLSCKETEIPLSIKSAYLSAYPVLRNIQNIHALGVDVIHPALQYKGIIDCIASYRDHTYVIGWKKSAQQKTSLATSFNTPIEIAAYIGAINSFNKYSFKVNRGLIIVAYTKGEFATIHELKDDALQTAWEEWLNRLEQFYTNYNKVNLNT